MSKCPKCNTEFEHEDYLFEVKCTKCSMRFNPFFDAMKAQEDAAKAEDPTPELEPSSFESPLPEIKEDFTESSNAFAELRDFGEGLDFNGNPAPTPAASAADSVPQLDFGEPPPSPPSEVFEAPAPTSFTPVAGGSPLMTSGETFEGFRIEGYLAPVSVWIGIGEDGSDPLKAAYESLWSRCAKAGGNGILAIKWSFTPDGTKVVMSGTPVRLSRPG